MRKPKILVVGSLVMDLIVTTNRFPEAGETVIGNGFRTASGGKGANQAVQAARLGANVTMFGKVGHDDFGKQLIQSACESGVDTAHIMITDAAPSAVGNVQIQSNEQGTENRIIVVPGANMDIMPEDVSPLKETIADYDMVILQNEIPMNINLLVAQYAKAAGVPVMLNPAPSAQLPPALISCLTYMAPNEHEAADITGMGTDNESGVSKAVEKLHAMGVENVIITLGKNGCVFSDGRTLRRSPSMDVASVVDPTAAGDSFIGAFCTAVSAGIAIGDALIFANCTAGITVSRMGAQTSLPTFDEVMAVMEQNGLDTQKYITIKGE